MLIQDIECEFEEEYAFASIIPIDYNVYNQINIIYHRLITILIMLIIMFGSINTIIELYTMLTILFILNKIENTL